MSNYNCLTMMILRKCRANYEELTSLINSGSQYTSETFREELNNAGVLQSLSGVNRCFDNARMESFFATLKKELLYRIPTYKMKMEEVKVIVFRYVFIYYNRIRIYTSNPDGLPPAAYRRRLEQPLAEAA